jgi:6,7-dimethyl-8-ribityllumazine synthase
MGTTYEGSLDAAGLRFAIVCARFNEVVSRPLLEGARSGLLRHGASEDDVDVIHVPGSFELPGAALKLAQTNRYDAVICVGAVIRGETPHFDFVAGQAAAGIMKAGLDTGVPIVLGVLTTDNVAQAIDRAGAKSGNKGWDSALTAIEMANLYKALRPD